MNDAKNVVLAWISTTTTLFAVIESRTLFTVISVFVMPIVFFAAGKAIDVAVQIYLANRKD